VNASKVFERDSSASRTAKEREGTLGAAGQDLYRKKKKNFCRGGGKEYAFIGILHGTCLVGKG